jgi:hypothetical protein
LRKNKRCIKGRKDEDFLLPASRLLHPGCCPAEGRQPTDKSKGDIVDDDWKQEKPHLMRLNFLKFVTHTFVGLQEILGEKRT